MFSSKHKRPLDLPEIKNHLAKFLSTKDIVACLRVSRSWHNSFAPCIWDSVATGLSPPSPSRVSFRRYPSLTGIYRNARFIRSLTLTSYPRFGSEETYNNGTTRFEQLEKLAFHVNQGCWSWLALGNLVRKSSRLLELRVDGQREVLPCLESAPSFWNAMQEAPLLRSLVIEDLDICERSAGALWDMCRRTGGGKGIRRLELYAICFETTGTGLAGDGDSNSNSDNSNDEEERAERAMSMSTLLPGFDLDSIVEFKLEVSRECKWSLMDQLRLLLRLTSVEKLRWSFPVAHRSAFPSFEGEWLVFQQFFQTATLSTAITNNAPSWPLIEELTLARMAIPDECLALMLKSFCPLSSLSVDGSRIAEGSLASLGGSQHCAALRVVSLRHCHEAKSSVVQEIMEHCFQLEELTADILRFGDVARGKPWACAGLRRLDVFIHMGGSTLTENVDHYHRHQLILGRMGELRRLEYLSVGHQSYGEVFENAIVLGLRTGLALLQGLDRMQSVYLEGTLQEMDRDDVEWMVNHWNCLIYIQSNICSDPGMRTVLTEYLHSHQVRVLEWDPCIW